MEEAQEAKVPAEVEWKGGRRVSRLPVGKGEARVVVTEYFPKNLPPVVTIRLEKGLGR